MGTSWIGRRIQWVQDNAKLDRLRGWERRYDTERRKLTESSWKAGNDRFDFELDWRIEGLVIQTKKISNTEMWCHLDQRATLLPRNSVWILQLSYSFEDSLKLV